MGDNSRKADSTDERPYVILLHWDWQERDRPDLERDRYDQHLNRNGRR